MRTRLAVTLTLVIFAAASASTVLEAQRGGGRAQIGAASMGPDLHGAGGGGRGSGGGRGGGARGGGGGVRGGGGFRNQGRMNVAPALPSINRPSFPIDGLNRPAFPLSGPLGFGRAQRSPFDARRGTYTRLHQSASFGVGYGYGGYDGAVYGPSYEPESTYDKMYRTQEPQETMGALLVDVTPATALVFIDTVYRGTVSDLQARGVALPPGRHWLDLEAPGFDKKTVEITISSGEPLRYRFDMTAARAAAAIVPERPETMYAIPGCYGGNRPPIADKLPPGCDIAKVRVIRPQPRVN